MRLRSRSTMYHTLVFLLAFLSMQVYALYTSTNHVFHDMPPMCALCDAVKKYHDSLTGHISFVPDQFSFTQHTFFPVLSLLVVFIPLYQSRAPPAPSI